MKAVLPPCGGLLFLLLIGIVKFRNTLKNILLKITLLKHTLLKKKTRPQLENWLAEQFFGLMV